MAEKGTEEKPVRVIPPLRPYALRVLVLLFVVGAVWTLWPLWAPLVLAAWFAHIARPLHTKLSGWMGKKSRGAAVATVILVVLGLTPFSVILLSLATDAADLVRRLTGSQDMRDAIGVFVNGETQGAASVGAFDAQAIAQLARQHGGSAFGTIRRIAGATTTAVIGVAVFVYGFYVFLAHGRAIHDWLCRYMPIRRRDLERFTDAFLETGRGIIVGFGLTALVQGTVAGIGYAIIGLPYALVLGLLTAVAGLVPAIGTGLVWVPLAAGLAMTGHYGQAVAVLAVGAVISLGDNFIRPALARYGRLQLPMFALFVAMLGGLAAFGAWGLVLGPLLLRLAAEGLEVLRERRDSSGAAPAAT